MDVTCERCGTRYEFDEALVSARGTTVKCTSCGHQFKVYRPDGAQELDGWLVRTIDGRELAFAAMRELQAAISSGQVAPDDVLIPKSGGAPRRLGRIEELQTFFAQSDLDVPTQRNARRPATGYAFSRAPAPYPEHKGTLLGGTRAPNGSAASLGEAAEPRRTGNTLRPPTGVPPAGSPPDPATIPHAGGLPDGLGDFAAYGFDEPWRGQSEFEPAPASFRPRRNGSVAMPLAKTSQHGSDEAVEALERAVHDTFDASHDRASQEELPSVADDDTMGDESIEERGPRPISSMPPGLSEPPSSGDARLSIDPLTPTPSAARPSVLRSSEIYSDPRFSGHARGRRPGIARWVIGIVGLGLTAVIGFTLLEKQLIPQAAPTATAVADARADDFLAEGERRLQEGDVEGAQEEFVKASAVAADDPRVARALARTAVVRADLLWLHKLLTREGTPHHVAVSHQLEAAVARARRATEAAVVKAPDDPVAASLEVDILRLEGRIDEARKLVSKLEGAGPDGARALAALDLTEASPSFGSVLDRLRTATRAERKLGRAHAMLIYALVRAGKLDEAKKELATLEGEAPANALIAVLRHQVEGTEPPAEAPPPPPPSTVPAPPPSPAPVYRPEPFQTAEPHAPPVPPPGDGTGSPPPPETPPDIDVSDLPEYH
jgi:predicted Zn finger-like uncharacterized protein